MEKKNFLSGYWKKNFGDDLFVKAICERYTEVSFFLETESYNKKVFMKIKNLNVIEVNNSFFSRVKRKIKNPLKSFTNYYQLAKKVPIYVEIGGSIFILNHISHANRALKKRVRIQKLADKYFILGSNFGPYVNNNQIKEYTDFFKLTDGVVFRDNISYNIFNDLDNVKVAPDAVLSIDVDTKENRSDFIVISLINLENRSNFTQNIINQYENNIHTICQYYLEKGKKVVLFGFCEYENDMELIERIEKKIPESLHDNIIKYIHDDIDNSLDYIKKAEIIFATRFHAMILGWLFKKPTVVFSYSNKTKNTIDYCFPDQYYLSIDKCDKLDVSILKEINNLVIPDRIRENLIELSNEQFYFLDSYLLDKSNL